MPQLQRHHGMLLLICGLALALRLFLLPMLHNPGLHDALHYYNLGARLAQGEGYTIDYVWHYNTLHPQIEHPTDHWMPLTGGIVGLSMTVFGINHWAAIGPFLLMGALLPLLVYASARQMNLSIRGALLAAALAVAIPEIVWQSLRPLTTLPQIWLYGGTMIFLVAGLRNGRWWQYALAGACLGLAYLNRNDAILLLPMIVLMAGLALWRRDVHIRWRNAILLPIVAAVVVAPWLIRNVQVLGQVGSNATTRMLLLTTYEQLYVYDDPITIDTWLAQGVGTIVAKRLFELAAAVKQMLTFSAPVLPLLFVGGGWLLWQKRDKERAFAAAPVLLLLLVTLVVYPFILPYQNQGGSFRTAFVSLLPMLLPIAAYAIETAIREPRWQGGVVAIIVGWSALVAWDTVRQDAAFNDTYYATMSDLADAVRTLPDVTGDDEIRLMAQDPFMLRYYGIRSVVVPYHSTEDVLAAAEQYQIDYVLLSTAWSDLDAFYMQRGPVDSHFELALSVPRAGRTPLELYAIQPDAD